jgi:hypothetical protein
MTCTGKIARLSHQIRDQLNHRLWDGEKAKVLVPWLNSLPEVLSILTTVNSSERHFMAHFSIPYSLSTIDPSFGPGTP